MKSALMIEHNLFFLPETTFLALYDYDLPTYLISIGTYLLGTFSTSHLDYQPTWPEDEMWGVKTIGRKQGNQVVPLFPILW